MVNERFNGARILPVYCIPDDRVLEQNIRRYNLWSEAQEIVGNGPSIITDNRAAANLQTLDERVATVMAAAEACYRFRPEYGTMAETASTFALHGSRWLGIQITDIPYRENTTRANRVVEANRKSKMAPANAREFRAAITARAQQIKDAIWRIARPKNDEHHTGYLGAKDHDAEQRIYCLLPFHPQITELIKEDVEDQLQRERFSGPFPGTKVCFAPGNANYSNHPNGYTYGHVCKIYGVNEAETPPSVARVLDPEHSYRGSRRRVLSPGEQLMQELGMPLNSMERNGHNEPSQMTTAPHPSPTSANGESREPALPPDMGTGTSPLMDNVGVTEE